MFSSPVFGFVAWKAATKRFKLSRCTLPMIARALDGVFTLVMFLRSGFDGFSAVRSVMNRLAFQGTVLIHFPEAHREIVGGMSAMHRLADIAWNQTKPVLFVPIKHRGSFSSALFLSNISLVSSRILKHLIRRLTSHEFPYHTIASCFGRCFCATCVRV